MSEIESYLFSEHEGLVGETFGPIDCDSCGNNVLYSCEIVGDTKMGDLLNLKKDTQPNVEHPCPELAHICENCVEHLIAAKRQKDE